MNSVWSKIQEWFAKRGGYSHVVAGAWVTISLAYDSVPSFKNAVVALFETSPHWLHEVIAAAVPLYIWYKNTRKVAS